MDFSDSLFEIVSLLGYDLLDYLLNFLVVLIAGLSRYIPEVIQITETSISGESFCCACLPICDDKLDSLGIKSSICDLNVGHEIAGNDVINVSLGPILYLCETCVQVILADLVTLQPLFLCVHVLDRAAEFSESESVNQRVLEEEVWVLYHGHQSLIILSRIQYLQIILEGGMADGLNQHGVFDLNNFLIVLRACDLLCSDIIEGNFSDLICQHADIIIVANGSRLELMALFTP